MRSSRLSGIAGLASVCLVVFAFATLPPIARAQFIGDYSLTPPAGGSNLILGQVQLGKWTAETWSRVGVVDTTLAPESCELRVESSSRPTAFSLWIWATAAGTVMV